MLISRQSETRQTWKFQGFNQVSDRINYAGIQPSGSWAHYLTTTTTNCSVSSNQRYKVQGGKRRLLSIVSCDGNSTPFWMTRGQMSWPMQKPSLGDNWTARGSQNAINHNRCTVYGSYWNICYKSKSFNQKTEQHICTLQISPMQECFDCWRSARMR